MPAPAYLLFERIRVGMVDVDHRAIGFADDWRRECADLHAGHIPQIEAAKKLSMARVRPYGGPTFNPAIHLVMFATGLEFARLDGGADVGISGEVAVLVEFLIE